MNFSDVGQMQMMNGATQGNRIKDLEKLYLSKYPAAGNQSTHQPAVQNKAALHFNQYVNNTVSHANQPNKNNPTNVLINKQLSGSRPQSSSITVRNQKAQLGRTGIQRIGNSDNGGDVFEGIAKVLDKIERLKSSEGRVFNPSDGDNNTTMDGGRREEATSLNVSNVLNRRHAQQKDYMVDGTLSSMST